MKIKIDPVTWKELPLFAQIIAVGIWLQAAVVLYADVEAIIFYPEWRIRGLIGIIGALLISYVFYGVITCWYGLSIILKSGREIHYPRTKTRIGT